jgi:phosphoribosylanthranilate isomerase
MWVKICANTSLKDALLAVEAGADAVGFVFAPSKRQVTAEQVRAIVAGLPGGVARLGVFAELPVEQIAAAAAHARLTGVQLHSVFEPERTARLRALLAPEVAIIQTVHWSLDRPDAATVVSEALGALAGQRVLLDAKVGGASGGLGLRFDWQAAGGVLLQHSESEVILAGGLQPETVKDAVQTVKPWGVDVASGVEFSPGVKDPAKVRAFVKNARGA